jgi:hypothetical protein
MQVHSPQMHTSPKLPGFSIDFINALSLEQIKVIPVLAEVIHVPDASLAQLP